jgi:hypothetical protein
LCFLYDNTMGFNIGLMGMNIQSTFLPCIHGQSVIITVLT